MKVDGGLVNDNLSQLEALLTELPSALENQSLGEELARTVQALHTAEQQALRIAALLSIVELLDYDSDIQTEYVEDVQDEARKVGMMLEQAETAEDLKLASSRYKNELSSAISNLDRDLRQHWRNFVLQEFRPLVDVGEMLRNLGGQDDLATELKNCGQTANEFQPGSDTTSFLEKVSSLVAKRDQLQHRRKAAFGEGEVASFINALAENRATLEMVSKEVKYWLEEKGTLNRLRVTI